MLKMFRIILGMMTLGVCALAGDTVLTFDAPHTAIHWTLGTVLHTVHGTFQLKSGTIHYDPSTGHASGQLIVGAASGESGSESRDKRMHQAILESVRFPEVVFTPDQVTGKLAAEGKSTLQVHGNFQLHGVGHEFVMPVEVEMKNGQASANARFNVPYIKWGLKNPSTFVLRCDDAVAVEIQAAARVTGL
jgi:polyisoprenoid-binding protein YceI